MALAPKSTARDCMTAESKPLGGRWGPLGMRGVLALIAAGVALAGCGSSHAVARPPAQASYANHSSDPAAIWRCLTRAGFVAAYPTTQDQGAVLIRTSYGVGGNLPGNGPLLQVATYPSVGQAIEATYGATIDDPRDHGLQGGRAEVLYRGTLPALTRRLLAGCLPPLEQL